MSKEKFFYLDESSVFKDKLHIRLNHSNFLFPNGTEGSYGVIAARALNLSYPDYLRYCRDRLGAKLIGKHTLYVVPYFDNTPEVQLFIKLLNRRLEYVMNLLEYPYEFEVDKEGNLHTKPITIN